MDTFSTTICSKIPPINEEMKNRVVEACLRMLLDTVVVHDKGKAVFLGASQVQLPSSLPHIHLMSQA